MFNTLVSIISFVVAIGLLVTFHEWGHFMVARRLKVKVLRFSVGFGKVIWRKYGRDGVEYAVSAIPLGGYVKMLDEREGTVLEHQKPFAFNRQSVYKRFAIVAAGPIANFLLAILFFTLVFLLGAQGVAPIVGVVAPDTPMSRAGMPAHSEIIAVNDDRTPTIQAVSRALLKHIDEREITLSVIHEGFERTITVMMPALSKTASADLFENLGLEFVLPARIGEIEPDGPAANTQLKTGDQVLAVDGKPIAKWMDLVDTVREQPGVPLTLKVLRGDQKLNIVITPDEKLNGDGYLGVYIASDLMREEKLPFVQSLKQAVLQTKHYSVLTLKMIYYMLVGQISLEHVSGPITIAQVAGASAQIGFTYFINFLAIVSISLGVLNLLPIPMLDGGHLLYYVVEMLRGKPLSEATQMLGFRLGIVVLMGLMLLALYNDILRLV